MYISMRGPPCGWNSAPSESHHKSEIKAPAKSTQYNASTLIEQITNRQTERMLLQTATYGCQLDNETETSQNVLQLQVLSSAS